MFRVSVGNGVSGFGSDNFRDPVSFQNRTGTSLTKDTSTIKFSRRSDQFFSRRYKPKCGKMPYLIMLKYPSKKLLDPDPDPQADDFRKFSRYFAVHEYICGKIFTKICSLVFTQSY